MKKQVVSGILGVGIFCISMGGFAQQAIYQLPNGGFENGWYRETSNAGSIVPNGYHSFYSASGSMASLASAQRCDSSRDVRSGATGAFSLRLYSNSTLGIRANGNVSTGRINAGSMTANNVENYNYTQVPTYSQEITGTPDSLRFWVKYLPGRSGTTNTTDMGRLRVLIHGTDECRDAPIYPSGKVEADYFYGRAMKEFYKEDGDWNTYTVPFEYIGRNTQQNANGNYYVLVSMTTNATPGGGANNADQVWFDDIEFIYNAWLTDLQINETTVDGFEKEILTYAGPALTGVPPYQFPYDPDIDTFSWTSDVSDLIKVVITNVNGDYGDADGGYTSILVTANDSVEASTISDREYRIYYFANNSENNNIDSLSYTLDGITPIPIQDFVSSQRIYNVILADTEEVRIPQFRAEDIFLSDSTSIIFSINQPTSVNSAGSITVQAENYAYKTYTFNFSKPVSTDSKLSWIKIGGTDIPNFDPDTLVYYYDVTACVTANGNIPTVTYTAESPWAKIAYTAATTATKTAIITVTAEDSTQTIYTINFNFINNDASILSYRVGTTNAANNVFSSTNVHATQGSYASTANYALSRSSTANQNPCSASNVLFPSVVRFYPDTNYVTVIAQDGITTADYKIILKNTNARLKQTSGNNVGLKYRYNGVVRNITIPSASNNNAQSVAVTIPVGPNVPAELIEAFADAPTVDSIVYVQPTNRTGSGTVTVYSSTDDASAANNRKVYTINFTSTISTDATLKSVSYSGNTVVNISPAGSTNYTNNIILPANAVSVPTLTAIPNFEWLNSANIVINPALTLSDTTTIDVTAENGTTRNTYKFAFQVVNDNDNAYLKSIKYNNIDIQNFNPDVYTYTVNIPLTTATPPVLSAVPTVANASVFYNQPTALPYQGKVLVYSPNMQEMKIYTVNLIPTASTDATLADIKIDGVLVKDFNPQGLTYKATLPYTQMVLPVITATTTSALATITSISASTFNGRVTIAVRAESGATNSYTIDISRELSPIANIDTIKYQHNNQMYAYKVNGTGTAITVPIPPETEDGEASISAIVLSDSRAVYNMYKQLNNDTATVTVFAENGTQKIYSVDFQKTLSPSTLLTDIFYDETPIANLDPNEINYTVYLPYNTLQIPVVSAEANWRYTDVQIDQPTEIFGQSQIYVTSEDGQNSVIYTINFEMLPTLSDLLIDEITIDNFNPEVLNYVVEYEYGKEDLPVVSAEAIQSDARIDITQIEEYPQTATITVFADDTTVYQTYTIAFSVEAGDNNYLSEILLNNALLPDFDKDISYYEVFLPYGTQLPQVKAVAEDSRAEVIVTQATQTGNMAKIEVKALNDDVREYQVFFAVEKNNNAHAKMIYVDWEPLKDFIPTTRNYNYDLPENYSGLPFVIVELEDPNASYEIIPPTTMPAQTQVIVTAEDGETQFSYRINFIKNNSVVSYNGNSAEIDVYPNPTKGELRIKNYELSEGNIEVYSVVGQLLQSKIVNPQSEIIIDVSHLANGMYYLKIGEKMLRFVKE